MDLIQVQRCESAFPWWTVDIESESEPGTFHQVMIPLPTDSIEDFICDCKGYEFRGRCRHIETIDENLCRWDSSKGPEEQSKDQSRNLICPRCEGKTIRTTEYS